MYTAKDIMRSGTKDGNRNSLTVPVSQLVVSGTMTELITRVPADFVGCP